MRKKWCFSQLLLALYRLIVLHQNSWKIFLHVSGLYFSIFFKTLKQSIKSHSNNSHTTRTRAFLPAWWIKKLVWIARVLHIYDASLYQGEVSKLAGIICKANSSTLSATEPNLPTHACLWNFTSTVIFQVAGLRSHEIYLFIPFRACYFSISVTGEKNSLALLKILNLNIYGR